LIPIHPSRIADNPNAALSLCESCAFARRVEGRNQQRYVLCGNKAIAVKNPPQPVFACDGYEAGEPAPRSARGS